MRRAPTNGGRLLLVLASRQAQRVTQLVSASGLTAADTLRQLQRRIDRGFAVVGTADGVAVYQLNAKGLRTERLPAQQRILVVDDSPALQTLATLDLAAEGYTVIVATTQLEAVSLVHAVSFDLVITDGFSRTAGAVLTTTAALRTAAGVTPVALFSAHVLAIEPPQVPGFAALIAKPCDLETLEA